MLPKLLGPAGLSGGVKPGACGGFRVLMDLFEADGITKACLLAGDSFFLGGIDIVITVHNSFVFSFFLLAAVPFSS